MNATMASGVLALALAALGSALPAFGQGAVAAKGRAADARAADTYRIGPADVLQISVWKNDALTQEVPVRPDGMISFPLVNEIRAAGLTPMQLRDLLARKLAPYVSSPQISVVVLEIHSRAVSVLGEVKTPGRYELKDSATVLDVLAMAGGTTEFATRTGIVVLRNIDGAVRRIPFNYDRFIAAPKSNARFNIYVEPGDVIVVP